MQHDFVIDNGPGLAVRTDMNAAVQALVTCSAGPVEPLVPYAGMLWLDTSVGLNGRLRQRDQSNTGWVDVQMTPDSRFGDADISFFARTLPNRFVWNDKADGTGTDIMVLEDTGILSLNGLPLIGISQIVPLARILATTTYTKPADLKYLMVEGCAPGGSSGGAAATLAGVSGCAGGGGAGAWGKRIFAASELAAVTTITVGTAGNAGAAGTNGTPGGTSEFGTGLNCTLGGGGASARSTNAANLIRGDGAVGGAPGNGWTVSGYGGNGGPGYGCYANTSAYAQRGAGGYSPYGQAATDAVSTGLGGIPGAGFGAGACGTGNAASQPARTGGDGAPGFFQLTEIK